MKHEKCTTDQDEEGHKAGMDNGIDVGNEDEGMYKIVVAPSVG